jgi:PAS domain S-box-containing protein
VHTSDTTEDGKVYPKTIAEMLAIDDVPVVSIDQAGLFTFVNAAFEKAYGWKSSELINRQVIHIMPPHLRDAHQVGFARFLTTEKVTLLGTPLPLSILRKDGRVEESEHFIIGEKLNGVWRFAAIIRPNR